ncbi:hypothetical protein JCM6882_002972 [Rhodosporidiobolus microsporus]
MSRLQMLKGRRDPPWAPPLPSTPPTPSSSLPPPSSSSSAPPPPAPLVAPSDLTQHLALLRLFHALEQRVRSTSTGLLAALSPSERWGAFLRVGALRLSLWVEVVACSPSPLPRGEKREGEKSGAMRWNWQDKVAALPLDAAVCWYAWALSGARYEGDVLRRAWEGMSRTTGSGGGRVGRDFPVEILVRRANDSDLLQRGQALWSSSLAAAAKARKQPSLIALAAWDATAVLAVPTGVEVECPWEGCGVRQLVPLLTVNNHGYAEPLFSHLCSSPSCPTSKPITREVLGVKNLLDDVRKKKAALPRRPRDEAEAERFRGERVQRGEEGRRREVEGLLGASLPLCTDPTQPYLLPLYTPHSSPSPLSGRALTSAMHVRVEVEKALAGVVLGRGGGASEVSALEEVGRRVDEGSGLPKRVITHLTAHTTPHALFSTDVALSALRLSEFVAQVEGVGWLEEGWGESAEGEAGLREAEGRYERFLALAPKIAGKEGAPLVPPLDVDFVWHTHLLMASQYRRDLIERFGSVVVHYDAIEESLAASQWDRGRKVREDKYASPLCTLPCYQTSSSPPGSSLSAKASGKIRRLFSSSSASSTPALPSLSASTSAASSAAPPAYTPTPSSAAPLPPSSPPNGATFGDPTAPSTHSSILFHRSKQDARRRKRREGEEPLFLRSPDEGAGVWTVGEEEVTRGGGVVGVDNYSPPSAWSTPFTHPASFDPDLPQYAGGRTSEDDYSRDGGGSGIDMMAGGVGRWAGTRA